MDLRRGSRYWLLVPLILLAIAARDWVERPVAFESEETIDMRALEADYYLEDFTTRRFGADGALEYRISGAALSHFPDDGRSEVETPRLELRRPGIRWTARADAGRLDVDPDVFTLLGDVRLERATSTAPRGAGGGKSPEGGERADGMPGDGPGGDDPFRRAPAPDGPTPNSLTRDDPTARPVTIRADDLSIALDTNEVSTDSAFEVVADGWRLTGVGLRSSIEEGKLMLLSDVNGTYDAASPD